MTDIPPSIWSSLVIRMLSDPTYGVMQYVLLPQFDRQRHAIEHVLHLYRTEAPPSMFVEAAETAAKAADTAGSTDAASYAASAACDAATFAAGVAAVTSISQASMYADAMEYTLGAVADAAAHAAGGGTPGAERKRAVQHWLDRLLLDVREYTPRMYTVGTRVRAKTSGARGVCTGIYGQQVCVLWDHDIELAISLVEWNTLDIEDVPEKILRLPSDAVE